ncbi:PIF-0 [Macrobrachium rosenbergii nudivirus]|nr:PIF-0 [Macrobrachium rosenbergii nudivirus]
MSYTNKDLENGMLYANQRYLLSLINRLYLKYPHLVTHLKYEIKHADANEDYYYPETFTKKAIMVKVEIPKKLCEKLSCNSVMAESACTRDTPASTYHVGDKGDYELQCQPSCYHLKDDPVIDEETGEEQVQMVSLSYNDEFNCVIRPMSFTWHQFPFYRSETVYEHRLNDLPIGFNKGPPDPNTYSKETYVYNKSYCDAYFDAWSEEKQTCVKKPWEVIAYAVVGESIIKMVKAGIQQLENNSKSDYPPVDLPEIPKAGAEWGVLGWKEDINESFIIPPVDFEFDDSFTPQRETDEAQLSRINTGKTEQNLAILQRIKNRHKQIKTSLRRKLENDITARLDAIEWDEITYVKSHNKLYKNDEDPPENPDQNIIDIIINTLDSIVSSAFTSQFWIDLSIGVVSDGLLDAIKVGFRKLANDLIPKLTVKLMEIGGKVMSKVFAKSLIKTVTATVGKIMFKTVSKIMIQMAKLAAEVASVVGIILAILTVFDILLTIFDPLGFNNKFDEKILESVTSSSDTALRKSLEVAIPQMTFEMFANMTLDVDEIIDESLHTFVYMYDYLDSLTVNSEGSRIDKGTEMDLSINDDTTVNDETISNTKLVTPKELYDYEKDHAERMKYFKISTKISISLLTISCLLLILDLGVIAIIFFILSLLVTFSMYINASFVNLGKMTKDIHLFNRI